MTIVKFFLHISKDEQKRRLQERIDDPDKHWKFNPGDLEERKHWDDYMEAYEDAIEATSTDCAHVVRRALRLEVHPQPDHQPILIEELEALKMKYPRPAQDYSGIVVEVNDLATAVLAAQSPALSGRSGGSVLQALLLAGAWAWCACS